MATVSAAPDLKKKRRSRFLPYKIDLISILVVVLTFGYQVAGVVLDWSWFLFLPVILGVRSVNLVEHNHSHRGVFAKNWLNEVFGWLCFISNGVALEIYRVHHVSNHHRFNQRFDQDGQDWSSTFGFRGTRFPDKPISRWYYVVTFPFIAFFSSMLELLRAPGSRALNRALLSFLVFGLTNALLIWVNVTGWVFFFLIPWAVVAFGLGFNNFSHHQECDMSDEFNSANEHLTPYHVLFGFNIGYHIEHHLKPSLHWSELPSYHREIRDRIPEERFLAGGPPGRQENESNPS